MQTSQEEFKSTKPTKKQAEEEEGQKAGDDITMETAEVRYTLKQIISQKQCEKYFPFQGSSFRNCCCKSVIFLQ